MQVTSSRGVIAPAIWLAIVIVGAVGAALFTPGSPFHVGKTPIQKQEDAQKALQNVKDATGKAAQRASHETTVAISYLPASRQKDIIASFSSEASGLLDQTYGAPAEADIQLWAKLVSDLESENAAIRAQADADRKTQADQAATLSGKLSNAQVLLAKANDAVTEYAKDNEAKAGLVNRVIFWGVIIIGGWFVAQLLKLFASANPSFNLASNVFNGVFAPVAHFFEQKAKSDLNDGLTRVGQAMGAIKADMPDVAAKVIPVLDGFTDKAHQLAIGAAADVAHAQSLLAKAKNSA